MMKNAVNSDWCIIPALTFLFISAPSQADTAYLCNLPTAAARAYANREARPGDEISFWTGVIAGRLVSSSATDNSVNLEGLWNTILPQLRWSSELRINASSGAIIGQFFTSGNDYGIWIGMSHTPSDLPTTTSWGWTQIPSGYANEFRIRNDSAETFFNFSPGQLARLTYGGLSTPFTVTYTTPANEYADYTVTFTLSADINMGVTLPNPAGGDFFRTGDWSWGNTSMTMTCTARGTALALTLDDSVVAFGDVPLGSGVPVVRTLGWKATGSGQATIWTMSIESADGQVDGNDFLLGKGRVRITDEGGKVIAPGAVTNISGTTGTYTLTLDPTRAAPGSYENRLNFRLAAN